MLDEPCPHGPTDETQPQWLIHRRTAITPDHIGRFVTVLLRELVGEGRHYDAVYTAFAESGIGPLPSVQCETAHFDQRIERLNRLADMLVEDVTADDRIRAAMNAIATTVLNQRTTPAPDEHLSDAELQEFIACCFPSECEGHISEDRYAVFHAHLGTCTPCDARLRDAVTNAVRVK